MVNECVVAVDIGTQSTRAALVDVSGAVLDSASSPINLFGPRPGWAEQDPEQWWGTTVSNIAAVMDRNPHVVVEAVGVGAQMHSLVAVGRDGTVLGGRSAIWSDKRCAEQVDDFLARADSEELSVLAGNRPLPAWSGFKMAWLRRYVPDAYARADWLLVAKDFINLRLSGEAATESVRVVRFVPVRRLHGAMVGRPVGGLGRGPLQAAPDRRLRLSYRQGQQGGGWRDGGAERHSCGRWQRRHDVPIAGLRPYRQRPGQRCLGDLVDRRNGRGEPGNRPEGDEPALASGNGPVRYRDAAGVSFRWFADRLGGTASAAGPSEVKDAYDRLTAEAAGVPPGSEGLLFFPYLLGERTLGSHVSRASFIGATLGHYRSHFGAP